MGTVKQYQIALEVMKSGDPEVIDEGCDTAVVACLSWGGDSGEARANLLEHCRKLLESYRNNTPRMVVVERMMRKYRETNGRAPRPQILQWGIYVPTGKMKVSEVANGSGRYDIRAPMLSPMRPKGF